MIYAVWVLAVLGGGVVASAILWAVVLVGGWITNKRHEGRLIAYTKLRERPPAPPKKR